MSAREELYAAALAGLKEDFVFFHEAESAAEKLIDDLLHEEAEKIRDMDRRNAWDKRSGASGAVLPSDVAYLIDPYKDGT